MDEIDAVEQPAEDHPGGSRRAKNERTMEEGKKEERTQGEKGQTREGVGVGQPKKGKRFKHKSTR